MTESNLTREETYQTMDREALIKTIKKQTLRIHHIKQEIESRQEENDKAISKNLEQNEELITLNQQLKKFNLELEEKVQARTQALEASKHDLEQQAQELQSLSSMKESLTHMIVHDMKNPLTVILATLRLFEKTNHGVPEEIYELLVDSYQQSKKLFSMMEEMLFISRMQTQEFQIKKERTDLVNLIQVIVDNMSKTVGQKKLALGVNIQAEELTLSIDANIIERVLNNLLNNSIKYAPNDSTITVAAAREGEQVVISVTNFGDPIPEAFHAKIFELFTRVNKKDKQLSGTGLGLAFCKMAVEAHGGKIWVTSPVAGEQVGTTFSFSLPDQKQD